MYQTSSVTHTSSTSAQSLSSQSTVHEQVYTYTHVYVCIRQLLAYNPVIITEHIRRPLCLLLTGHLSLVGRGHIVRTLTSHMSS